jgi:hypothetical protein
MTFGSPKLDCAVPTGLILCLLPTRHFRAGLSLAAATRLVLLTFDPHSHPNAFTSAAKAAHYLAT